MLSDWKGRGGGCYRPQISNAWAGRNRSQPRSSSALLELREAILNDDFSSSVPTSFPSMGLGGQAQPKRFNGSIVIRNNKFQEMIRYNFMNAWVVSWEGPKLDSMNSSLAISKVEIAHHGIEVIRDGLMVTGWL